MTARTRRSLEDITTEAGRDPDLAATRWEELRSQIRRTNSEINAIVALAPAPRHRPGPTARLEGLVCTVKDNTVVEGLPTSFGVGALHAHYGGGDDPVVRQIASSGVQIVGKTSMPEFGSKPITVGGGHGFTRSPLDPTRSAGGSSGGAAASVAADYCDFAHGTDAMGSVRIPAACCGVVGAKFSRRHLRDRRGSEPSRTPPTMPVRAHGLFAHSVRDLAFLIDRLAIPQAAEAVARTLRVGIDHATALNGAAHDDLEVLAGEMGAAGWSVAETDLGLERFGALNRMGLLSALPSRLPAGLTIGDLEPYSQWLAEQDPGLMACQQTRGVIGDLQTRLSSWDAVVLPCMPSDPPLYEAVPTEPRAQFEFYESLIALTAPFNWIDIPAMNVPTGRSLFGSVQIVARSLPVMLTVARLIENLRPLESDLTHGL